MGLSSARSRNPTRMRFAWRVAEEERMCISALLKLKEWESPFYVFLGKNPFYVGLYSPALYM